MLELPDKLNYHCNLLAKTHASELTVETNVMYNRHIPDLFAFMENEKCRMTQVIFSHLYRRQHRKAFEILVGFTGVEFDAID